MIKCTLGEKTYTIPFVSARALREVGPAMKMYEKLKDIGERAVNGETPELGGETIEHAMDVMIKWFCLLFKNQFTEEEFLDNYPVDDVVHDIVLAMLYVQGQVTGILTDFPMTPAARMQATKKA